MITGTLQSYRQGPLNPRMLTMAAIAMATVAVLAVNTVVGTLAGDTSAPIPNLVDLTIADVSNAPPAYQVIPFFEQRLAESPDSYIDLVALAGLHLQNARDAVDPSGVSRAEESVAKALEINPDYPIAIAMYAHVLSSQHRFAEAKFWADKAAMFGASRKQAAATLADIQVAEGNYDEASRTLFELSEIEPGAASDVRVANLEFLHGDPKLALRIAVQAAESAYLSGVSRTQMSWYLWRIGTLYFEEGELDDAMAYFQAADRLHEEHFIYSDSVAGVLAARGDYESAIELYQASVTRIGDPASMIALGDLYRYLGRSPEADATLVEAEIAARKEMEISSAHNLEHAVFFANHDIHLPEALALANAELLVRQNVETYDAAAWIHYKNGLFEEAERYIDQALALGTRKASFYFHAGMIDLALGDELGAVEHLEQALLINPHFSLIHSRVAQAELARLQETNTHG